MPLNVPTLQNKSLRAIVDRIDASEELQTLWAASNITAIDRMGINDHGPVHIRIMTNIALKLLRLLVAGDVSPNAVSDHGLTNDDAEVIVVLASVLHDVGHAIHRENHETLSLILAAPLLDRLLDGLYDTRTTALIKVETLHAIYTHQRSIAPLTIEAGVVKVADALDMESGRARIPFALSSPTVHSVSAMAIRKVHLARGAERPIKISIEMSNSAGIFQLDNLLREKLKSSTIASYVEVEAEVVGNEKNILQKYTID
ncbi:HD domain-containing protein [Candidatus Bipolaricaulota bacterium]|nr:HD domain-containing protein [Candidatus Bipolaricaulota bacterium]